MNLVGPKFKNICCAWIKLHNYIHIYLKQGFNEPKALTANAVAALHVGLDAFEIKALCNI